MKLLLEGNSVTAAAAQANIHRTTIHHWCRTLPEFVHALDAARRNRHALLHDEMDRLASHAIEVIEKTLTDESVAPALRVNAALAVLRGANQASAAKPLLPRSVQQEVEMENYLRSLENELAGAEKSDTVLREARASASADAPQPHAEPELHSRNGRCPCGSGAKFKRCCGTGAPPLDGSARTGFGKHGNSS